LRHAPVLATCSYHRQTVEAAGIEFHPMRPDVDPGDVDLIRRVMDPRRGSEVVVRELTAAAVRQQYDGLPAAARHPHVLVPHPVPFAAPIVAERLGLPWLSTALAPISFFSTADFPVLPNLPCWLPLHRGGPLVARGLKRLVKSATSTWTAPVRELRKSV